MITVSLFGIAVVFFAYLARFKHSSMWLKLSFILIFFLLALRYDYGNDYKAYLLDFIDINRHDIIDYFSSDLYYDPGWLLLCRLFKPFGFFAMVATLSAFLCFVYYRFTEKYVPPQFYWLSVLVFYYSPDIMLVQSTAMRQSIAIALFIFSIGYIFKKDLIRYVLCIALASAFHASILILLPVYFLGLYNKKIPTPAIIVCVLMYAAAFVMHSSILQFINLFAGTYFEKYTRFQEASSVSSGLGVAFQSVILLMILFLEKNQAREVGLVFKIAALGYIFIPLSLAIMMLVRMGFYFQPAAIVVYPYLVSSIKLKPISRLVLILLLFITAYNYYSFFQSDVWKIPFGTYKTIFESPVFY